MKNVIYGLGERFEEYLLSVDDKLTDIIALVDKDNEKHGKYICGVKVVSPSELDNISCDNILISSEKYFEEIKTELVLLGCEENKIKKLEYRADKYSGELAYWRMQYRKENGNFRNHGYKEIFLEISGESDDVFLDNKIMADFGCGPRGSLAWTSKPKVKIGIDVLANAYMRYFGDCLEKHDMIYLNSDEYRIPLPNCYVDIISTINSLDHVADLDNMVEEICRVLKPGGLLLGSFNLHEPKTQCEPQTLTEELLNRKLLYRFDIISKKIAIKGKTDTYSELKAGNYVQKLLPDQAGEMWVKARLKNRG